MKKLMKLGSGAIALGAVAAGASAQVDITRWGFSTTAAVGTVANPAPSFGTGAASVVGMSGAGTDVVQTGTALIIDPDPLSTGLTWRIRGLSNFSDNTNGWDNVAPQYSQGIQFMASTVGFTSVMLDFDWFSTNQGIRNLQVQYTLDGSTWNNYKGTYAGGVATDTDAGGNTQLLATPNAYNAAGTAALFNEADFSSISGASNNANFGVRMVSAFDKTLGAYASATLLSGAPQLYNGTSGNWRIDQIAIRGTASSVPEPMSFAVLGIGVAALIRRKKRS